MARASAAARGYDPRWRRYRDVYLSRNPWCRRCAGRGVDTRATVVNHIRPHKGSTRLFWLRSNHEPLCATCHNGPTQSYERTGRERGCDLSGNPLDVRHHWNQQETA